MKGAPATPRLDTPAVPQASRTVTAPCLSQAPALPSGAMEARKAPAGVLGLRFPEVETQPTPSSSRTSPGPSSKPGGVGSDPTLQLRLGYLWQSALSFLETRPLTSRVFSRELVRVSNGALTELGPVADLLCSKCGAVQVPGKTSRVRLRSTRGLSKRRRKHAPGKPCLKNEMESTCLLCGEKGKATGVVREHKSQGNSILGASSSLREGDPVKKASPVAEPSRVSHPKPPVAPAPPGGEEFIPLGGGGGRGRGRGRGGEPARTLLPLDSKPRKRKRPPQQEAPESQSLGNLRTFISSLNRGQPGKRGK